MFSQWIFTLSISTIKFLWYSPHFLSKFLHDSRILEKFSYTYFLYTTISEVQTIFVWTQSYRGARLRFHFQKSKGFLFYFGWKQNRVSEIPTGYLFLELTFSFRDAFFLVTSSHYRGLFVFLIWILTIFIEMHTPIFILEGRSIPSVFGLETFNI